MANFWENDPIVQPASTGKEFWANDPVVGEEPERGFFQENVSDPFKQGLETRLADLHRGTFGAAGAAESAGHIERMGERMDTQGPEGALAYAMEHSPSLFDTMSAFQQQREEQVSRLAEGAKESLAKAREHEKAAAAYPMSEGMKEFQEAEGFWPSVGAVVRNPQLALEVTSSSLPYMATSIAGGVVAGLPGFAAGTFAAEYDASMREGLAEQGIDVDDDAALLRAASDPEVMGNAKQFAATRGSIIALLDTATFKIAGKTLSPKMKSRLAQQMINMPAQTLVQGAGGGLGEAGASYATTGEVDTKNVILEVIGEGPTAFIEVPAAMLNAAMQDRASRRDDSDPPPPAQPAPQAAPPPQPTPAAPAAPPQAETPPETTSDLQQIQQEAARADDAAAQEGQPAPGARVDVIDDGEALLSGEVESYYFTEAGLGARVITPEGAFEADLSTFKLRTPEAAAEAKPFYADDPVVEETITPPKPRAAGPQSLMEFLSDKGVKPTGELSDLEADIWHKARPGRRKFMREDGRDPDYAREAAEEAGYLPEGSTVADLYDAIDREIRGQPVYLPEDQAKMDARATEKRQKEADRHQMESVADSLGIKEYTALSDKALAKALEDYKPSPDPAVQDQVEDAESIEHDRIVREVLAETEEVYNAPDDLTEADIPYVIDEARPEDSAEGIAAQAPSDPAIGPEPQADAAPERAPTVGPDPSEGGAEAQPGGITTEQTDQGEQAVIPGAEKISDRESAERQMQGRKKAAVPQKDADIGLFDTEGRKQTDLMDFAGPARPEKVTPVESQAPVGPRNPDHDLATNILAELRRKRDTGGKMTWRDLFRIADEHYGGTQAEGRYQPKDAYDAMEMAVNMAVITEYKPLEGDFTAKLKELDKIGDVIPTQSKRTVEQQQMQQFSTPPHYAALAAWVGNPRKTDVMLEPSAGTGSLIAPLADHVSEIHANELSDSRAVILDSLPADVTITKENAEQIANILDVEPDLVVMNPPFSQTAGRMGDKKDLMVGAKHIEQALELLKPGGRLVAIVGRGMEFERPRFRKWWEKMAGKYTVRANIGIQQSVYRKYGTSFGTRLLVFDKIGPADLSQAVKGDNFTLQAAAKALQEVRNARAETISTGQPAPAQPASGEGAGSAVPGADDGRRRGDQPSVSDGVRAGGQPTEPRPAPERVRDDAERPSTGQPESRDARDRARGAESAERQPAGSSQASDRDTGRSDTEPRSVVAPTADSGVSVEKRKPSQKKKELTESVYESYRPAKVRVRGAKPHPTKLVESAAMASVLPADVDYKPNLPQDLITSGALSEAQLEPIIYAGQAHSTHLLGEADKDGKRQLGARRGYFIGDGTGVGKGREVSGIILDNWRQGRKKALWVSKNKKLRDDAIRDWTGLGGQASDILDLSKFKTGSDIDAKQGVMFVTYDTLRSGGKAGNRLDQLVKWLGKDFDGVIAFDEAHKMANATEEKGSRGMKKASQVALAGIDLQYSVKDARVVYVSATGATEINNLAYATRLGLWGPGTPFSRQSDFINKMAQGGVAAMELIARDLKQMGLYAARNLSFDGVKQAPLEHKLTAEQIKTYDRFTHAWQIVLNNIDDALEETGGLQNARAKAAARSAFWGAHQRFFNSVMTSMQMPTVVKQMEKDIKDGMAIVVQLVNTNEAQQERAAKAMEGQEDIFDLDLSPREGLLRYVERSFPILQYETYIDEDGRTRSRVVKDANDEPVINRAAVKKRDDLLVDLATLPAIDPPLEQLLGRFGTKKVSEVTGRKSRFIRQPDGSLKQEKRGARASKQDIQDFLDDKKDILVFSQAGGTGASYHAGKEFKNQRPRAHYLLQAGWRADEAVQGFGRSHRSNQANTPTYRLVQTNLKGHKRFIATIARRLDQLGALTKGSRKTGGQGMFSEQDNLESPTAKQGLVMFWQDLMAGKVEGLTFQELESELGLNVRDPETRQIIQERLPTIDKFLGRILSLPVARQNMVFDAFTKRFEEALEIAKMSDSLDLGVETFTAESIQKASEDVIHTEEFSGSETKLINFDVKDPARYISGADIKNQAKEFYRNRRSGRLWALTRDYQTTDADTGNTHTHYIFQGQAAGQHQSIPLAKLRTNFDSVPEAEALKEWDDLVAKAPSHIESKLSIVTGTVIPVWDRLPGDPRVRRLQDDAGEVYLGRVISQDKLGAVRKNFGLGITKIDVTPEQAFDNILKKGAMYELSNGWALARSRVSGAQTIEIRQVTNPREARQAIEADGGFTQLINYKPRFFVPTDKETGLRVLKNITDKRPIVRDMTAEGSEGSYALAHGNGATTADRATPDVLAAIEETMAQVAPSARLKVLPDLPRARGVAAEVAGGQEGDVVAGVYYDGLVMLAYNAVGTPDQARGYAIHEGVHALKDMGFFTDQEWQVLQDHARKVWLNEFGLPNNQAAVEEAVAYGIQYFKESKPQSPGPVSRVIRKVRRFFARLVNKLRKRGFQTHEDVVGRVLSGEIGARPLPEKLARRKGVEEIASLPGVTEAQVMRAMQVAEKDKATIQAGFKGVKLSLADLRARAAREVDSMRGNLETAENVGVDAPEVERDLNTIKRPFYIPAALFKRWPALGKATDRWSRRNIAFQAAMTRVQNEWDQVTGKLSKEDFATMSSLLFEGDSLGRVFSDGEMADRGASPAAIQGYRGARKIFDKLGRLVNQHERSMRGYLRNTVKPILIRRALANSSYGKEEGSKAINRRYILRAQFRNGQVDPETVQAKIGAINQNFNEKGQAALVELDIVDSQLSRTSVTKREGYVPHKFFGSWGVYRVKVDDEGTVSRELIADYAEHGFHATQEDAVRAANQYAAGHKDERIVVRPVNYGFAGNAGQQMSGPRFQALLRKLQDSLEISHEEAVETLGGVVKPRGKRRFAGFKQMRKGIEGYSKDLDRVVRSHIGEVIRYSYLDRVKYEAITLEERMHLEAGSKKRPVLGAAWRAYVRDMLGEKQPLEANLDELFDKSIMTPLNVALGGGLSTFVLVGGLAGNPMVGAMLGGWVGYRFYTARKEAANQGGFYSRSLTGELLSTTAHLKLGMFLNVFSPLVNLTQIFLNTASVLPYRYVMRGFTEAMQTLAGGQKYRRMLDRHNIDPLFKHSEISPHVFEKQPTTARYSMLLFDTAEKVNRATTFLAAYHQAMDGAAPGVPADNLGAAQKYAQRIMTRTQFDYSNAMKPEALRNVFARVPLQFKNFVMQQIAFVMGLKRTTELPKFLAHMLVVAGALGLPGIQLVDWLYEWLTDDSLILKIKEEVLRMQASGGLAGTIASALARGFPSLVGVDISTRTGMGDKFLPEMRLNDLIGPWPSTMLKARQLAENEAGIVDQMRNLSTGVGAPFKALETAANGMPVTTMFTDPDAFFDALGDDKAVLTSPWKKERAQVQDEDLSNLDIAMIGVGGMPTKVSKVYDFTDVARHKNEQLSRLSNRYMNRIADAYRARMPHRPAEFRREVTQLVKDARDEGLVIAPQAVKRLVRDLRLGRIDRTILQSRKQLRPELMELREGAQ